jgi:hypothetical protein
LGGALLMRKPNSWDARLELANHARQPREIPNLGIGLAVRSLSS